MRIYMEEARDTKDNAPILGAHFDASSYAERELGRGGRG